MTLLLNRKVCQNTKLPIYANDISPMLKWQKPKWQNFLDI